MIIERIQAFLRQLRETKGSSILGDGVGDEAQRESYDRMSIFNLGFSSSHFVSHLYTPSGSSFIFCCSEGEEEEEEGIIQELYSRSCIRRRSRKGALFKNCTPDRANCIPFQIVH